ncbi:MAG: SDR family NAD(P)-dependent oxidoreductase [Clostridiales bacterium]|nr:SDR family NAD(P)-dependent oxidoreductase [Clostridiales bacterium]
MKYVLITGGASGMGRATALKLAENGYQVFSCDIKTNEKDVDNIIQLKVDVTDMESVKKAYDFVRTQTDSLCAIINFAGIIMMNSLIEISEEDFIKIFNINLFGAFRVNKMFFPLIKKGNGRIIITTSELAPNKILPFNAIYSISKKALDAYAQGLTMELGILGIPVITLRPGAVETPILKNSNEEMAALNSNTTLYKKSITKFKSIVDKEQGGAIAPEKIADLVVKILNKKNPRCIYKKNISKKLKLLNLVPTKMQIKIFKMILK